MSNSKIEKAKQKQERIGSTNYNNFGSKMTIIKYTNTSNILVKFENGYTVKANYLNFKTGEIKSPYDKSVYNIGYIGEGKYKPKINSIKTEQYNSWYDMMKRCYSNVLHKKRPTYIGCTVCDEWHNFQNFAKWYDKNYYEIENQRMCLDKDILHKGNKIYSPETCIFVPQNINSLFTKTNALRGKYPIGVRFRKDCNKYNSCCSNGNKKRICLGVYNTPEEAFYVYKNYKENLIKQIADKYKNKIPQKLYNAMYKYKVEITD